MVQLNTLTYRERVAPTPAPKRNYMNGVRKILKAPAKMYGAMNMYFFGETHIHISDALWYYGTLCFSVIMLLIVTSVVY